MTNHYRSVRPNPPVMIAELDYYENTVMPKTGRTRNTPIVTSSNPTATCTLRAELTIVVVILFLTSPETNAIARYGMDNPAAIVRNMKAKTTGLVCAPKYKKIPMRAEPEHGAANNE